MRNGVSGKDADELLHPTAGKLIDFI